MIPAKAGTTNGDSLACASGLYIFAPRLRVGLVSNSTRKRGTDDGHVSKSPRVTYSIFAAPIRPTTAPQAIETQTSVRTCLRPITAEVDC